MKSSLKKHICLAMLAVLLIAALSSCTGNGNTAVNTSGNTASDDPQIIGAAESGGSVYVGYRDFSYTPEKTVTPTYVLKINPLEVKNPDYPAAQVTQISGLKDKSIEDKINRVIKEEYDRLSDPDFKPPVMGVEILEKSDKPRETSVYCNETGSYFNILSVSIHFFRNYDSVNPADAIYLDESIRYVSTLNFDLSTGEQIALKDLFIDGVDHVKYLNSKIRDRISNMDISSDGGDMYYGNGITVTSDFKGIREDQPFALSSFGNDLVLYFDSGNPEFYSQYSVPSIAIDISEVSAIETRFGQKRGLYEAGDEYELRFRDRPFDNSSWKLAKTELADGLEKDRFSSGAFVGPVNLQLNLREYSELSKVQNSFLALDWTDFDSIVEKAIKDAETKGGTKDDPYFTIYAGSTASRNGPYINLDASYTVFDRNYKVIDSKTRTAVYKEGSDRELELKDVFKKGVDWKSVIKQGTIETIRKNQYYEVSADDPRTEEFIDLALERITGFHLGLTGLSLSFDEDLPDVLHVFEPYSNKAYEIFWTLNGIEYKNIGYENITIFDDYL